MIKQYMREFERTKPPGMKMYEYRRQLCLHRKEMIELEKRKVKVFHSIRAKLVR